MFSVPAVIILTAEQSLELYKYSISARNEMRLLVPHALFDCVGFFHCDRGPFEELHRLYNQSERTFDVAMKKAEKAMEHFLRLDEVRYDTIRS